MSEQSETKQTVIGAKYAATSATGAAAITIYNYYCYREEVRVAPVEPAEASADGNLPCPYRGLFHFSPKDAEFFFGREVFVEKLVQATQTRNFIPVLGASGSGKSSVVFAGLVPRLQQGGHWKFTYFRPGAVRTKEGRSIVDPFYALATALVPLYTPDLNDTKQLAQASDLAEYFRNGKVLLSDVITKIQQNHPNHRVLLIADQFEELYTLCQEDKIRHSFLDILLDSLGNIHSLIPQHQSPLVFVATMRADFLGNALSYSRFADLLQNPDTLGAMNRDQLLQVIGEPAKRLGVTFADELVKRILDDVENEPGNLPLLEFALTLLWKRRTGKQLTHAAYEAIGKVQGALASHADEKYGKLSSTQPSEQIQRIFIQLVRPGEGTEDTRRLATKAELGEASWSLVKQLADARLVVTNRNADGQETVEVVHEALIRNWGQLREWMETDRIFRAWQDRLRGAMHEWEETKRDEGALLRGALLAEAEEKLQERREELSIAEQEFIQQSIALRERLQRQEQIRKISLLILAGVVFLSILSAVGFSIRAWFQEKTTKSLQLANASETNLNVDTTRSLWLAIAAKLTQDTPQADLALWNALQANHERFQLVGHEKGERVIYAEFDPRDSKRVLTVSSDRTARIWNLDNLGNPRVLKGHEEAVKHGCFDPQNPNRILTVSFDGTARIWNLDNPNNPDILRGHQGPINYGSFDPKNSNRVLTVSSDGTARVWNLAHRDNPLVLKGHEGDVWVGSFDPQNSNRVLTVSSDATARIWELSKPNNPLTLRGHKSQVVYGTFDPKNSNRVLTVSSDRTARIWNLNTPTQPPIVLSGHSKTVRYGSFDPQDRNRVLTVSEDGTVRLWNLKNLAQPQILRGHQGEVLHGAFNPEDANQILTVSSDGTARIWDLQTSSTLFTFRGHVKGVNFGTFDSQNSSRILTVSDDSTARIWDISDKTFIQISEHQNPENHSIISSTFDSSQPNRVLTIDRNGIIKNWNSKDIKDRKTFPNKLDSGSIEKAWFAPNDSNRIATVSSNNIFSIWNIKEPHKSFNPPTGEGKIEGIRFDPKKSNRILRINSNHTATIWDTSNRISIELPSLNPISEAQFDPNNPYRVATASVDGTVRLWNLQQLTKPLKPSLEFSASKQQIWRLSFDPKNSNRLLTMGSDKVARVWNLDSRSIVTELYGHQKAVVDGSFDPNNPNRVLTVSYDGTARIWDLRIPNNPLIIKERNRPIVAGSFDPHHSNQVITVDRDGTAVIHMIGSQELLKQAWNISSRCLADEETNSYNLRNLNLRQLLFNHFSKFNPINSANFIKKYRPNCQEQFLQNNGKNNS